MSQRNMLDNILRKQKPSPKNIKKEISFTLPSDNSEILDIHFLQHENKEQNDEILKSDDRIQIVAMDYQNKVLVVATWDVA